MSDVGRGSREICPVETGYVTMLVHFRLEHLLDGTFCDLLYQTSVAEQVGARLQVQILDALERFRVPSCLSSGSHLRPSRFIHRISDGSPRQVESSS